MIGEREGFWDWKRDVWSLLFKQGWKNGFFRTRLTSRR